MATELTNEEIAQVNIVARGIARKFGRWQDLDDMRQDGYIGMMAAKQTFDPTYNVPFAAYAYTKVNWTIRDGVRERTLLGPVYITEKNKVWVVPIDNRRYQMTKTFNTAPADIYQREVRTIIEQCIDALPKRLAIIVQLYFLEEQSLEDVGIQMNLSYARVNVLLQKALLMLRDKLSACL